MRILVLKALILLAFSFTSALQTEAQTVRQEGARKHLEKLKDGVLIVRLSTLDNTFRAMEAAINNPENSQKDREVLEKDYLDKKYVRDSVNQMLLTHFGGETYTYSRVYFMYDSSLYRLKENEASGYFMNKNLEIVDSFTIKDKDYYQTYIGRTPQSMGTNTQAFVILDKYSVVPDPPFPGYITFRKGLAKRKSKKKDKKLGIFTGYTMEEVIQKFEDSLNWTYHKAQAEW